MRVVAVDGGQDRDLDVRVAEDARIGDLSVALFAGSPAVDSLTVGDRVIAGQTLVAAAGIAAGSRIALSPPTVGRAAAVDLDVLSGRGAGSSVGLPAGSHIVGNGADATIAYRTNGIRARHAAIHVSARGAVGVGPPDAAPACAVGPATLIELGGSLLGISRRQPSSDRLKAMPGRRGTVAFNRPPRRVPRRHVPPVAYPEALTPPSSTSRLSLIGLIVPLLFGLTMAILIHPRMALFALLGPVMMAGGWLEDRRRNRKYVRDAAAHDVTDLATVATALDRTAAVVVLQHHQDHPSVAELARWAAGSTRLWERRPHHEDFMRLMAGYGAAPWQPPTEGNASSASDQIRALVASRTRLPRGPVAVDVRSGNVVGVAGPRDDGLATVRGLLCQAAVLHGPADLQIAVVTDRPGDWEWTSWLPHTLSDTAAERRLLASTPDERNRLVAMLTPSEPVRTSPGWGATRNEPSSGAAPLTVLVVDTAGLAEPEGAGLRFLLGGGGVVAGVVLARRADELPSVCTAVLEVEGHQARMLDHFGEAVAVSVAGAEYDVAVNLARHLAGFADPERREDGAELPSAVKLAALLDADIGSPEAIVQRWRGAGTDPPLAAPIGVTEAGPLVLDVVNDGPHGLLAGTTGSGKSELLRTLVASLALAVDPEHLTFVLIDYKGGSAFDACADLPHAVGMVTDLDDQLAARALECLEAELRYREHRLRDVGADDIAAYLRSGPAQPLPRMLIVIDEFAALAKELPEFMDALVDIAARGRSLGVHLLLATQRPAGVIRDNVRANTNLRMALRVQDRSDSADVLGDPRAAAIARSQPGRGYVRLGPGEVIPFQAALVTGTSGSARRERVALREISFGMEAPAFAVAAVEDAGPTDLERIVASAGAAAELAGFLPPRRPWPEPLPEMVSLQDLDVADPPTDSAVPVGLVDEPDFQRQRTMWWDPRQGSLAMYGLTGAGTTTALATIATSLAHRFAPEDVHLYVMDFDAGALSPLAALAHVGAVVVAAERERQVRLVRRLSAELERRKHASQKGEGSWPLVVLLVDNFAGLAGAFEATPEAPIRDALYRVLMEGQGVGMVAAVTGVRQNAVPLAIAATFPSKLVFRMADPLAAATFGLRRVSPDLPTGRAIHVTSKRTVQLASPHPEGLSDAVALLERRPGMQGGPPPIDELPTSVKTDQLAASLRILDEEWWVPVGIGDTQLSPVGLPLGPGDHVLIAGEPRSGRSSLLCAIGEVVAQRRPDVRITAVVPRKSPLRDLACVDELITDPAAIDAAVAAFSAIRRPHLVLIDDVDGLDATPALRALLSDAAEEMHVIATARRDLKSQYNHWARDLCKSRVGVWLKPGPGLDGDLWNTPMPRHLPAGLPVGRGLLVAEGTVELIQAMRP